MRFTILISVLIALIATSCRNSLSFQSSRFRPGFYVDAHDAAIPEIDAPFTKYPGSDNKTLVSNTKNIISVQDTVQYLPENKLSASVISSPTVFLTNTSRDTIPPEDEYQQKLTKKEKRALAIVVSGSVIMFTGIALLVYVLLGLLTGLTFTPVFYYLSAGLILIGYLIRELGYSIRN